MSLVKLARPYQQKLLGGCMAHLKAYLEKQPGRARDIADATGYTISTVQNEIADLKRTNPELAKRVIDGRFSLNKKPAKPKAVQPPRERHVLPTAAEVVESALKAKTNLEKAWK